MAETRAQGKAAAAFLVSEEGVFHGEMFATFFDEIGLESPSELVALDDEVFATIMEFTTTTAGPNEGDDPIVTTVERALPMMMKRKVRDAVEWYLAHDESERNALTWMTLTETELQSFRDARKDAEIRANKPASSAASVNSSDNDGEPTAGDDPSEEEVPEPAPPTPEDASSKPTSEIEVNSKASPTSVLQDIAEEVDDVDDDDDDDEGDYVKVMKKTAFARGLKFDPEKFRELKHDGAWLSWITDLRMTAQLHDFDEVFDDFYDPTKLTSAEAKHDYRLKQLLVYKVFKHSCKTSSGGRAVLRHVKTFDGRAVFKDMELLNETGLVSYNKTENAAQALRELRLTEKWSKPTLDFLHLFDKKVMYLLNLDADYLTARQQYDLLEKAFRGHSGFESTMSGFRSIVKLQSTMDQQRYETYDFLYNHLQDSCIEYDATHKATPRPQRAVHQAQQGGQAAGRGNSGAGRGGRGNGPPTMTTGGNGPAGVDATRFAAYMAKPHTTMSNEKWNELSYAQRDKLRDKRATTPKTAAFGYKMRANYAQTGTPTAANDDVSVPASENGIPSSVVVQPMNGVPMQVNTHTRPGIQNMGASVASSVQGTMVTAPDGTTHFYRSNMHRRLCVNHAHYQRKQRGSLVDSGANGGLCGSDMLILGETGNEVDVTGIDNHTVPSLKIGTAAGLAVTLAGEKVILLYHQYALKGTGPTIHCPNQLRAMGHGVDERPRALGGTARITTSLRGYILPLAVRDGLAYLDMEKPTMADLDKYPVIMMTSDGEWNPTQFDSEVDMDTDSEADHDDEFGLNDIRFDDDGITYHNTHTPTRHGEGDTLDYLVNRCVRHAQFSRPNLKKLRGREPNYNLLRPFLGWIPIERVKETLKHTEAWYRLYTTPQMPIRHLSKSRFPAANVDRLRERYATDTIHSDVPAMNDGIMGHAGATCFQLFVGHDSHYAKGYPMQTESRMSDALEDFIRDVGAPSALLSDNAKAEIGRRVEAICRMYAIRQVTTEPGHPEQNSCERHTATIKPMMENIQRQSGSPAVGWVLLLKYVLALMNVLALKSLAWRTPTEVAFGRVPDISPFLQFSYYEPVYCETTGSFPSQLGSVHGRFVGIAENSGPHMTFLVLCDDTLRAVPRSNVISRSALPPPRLPDLLTTRGEDENDDDDVATTNFDDADAASHEAHDDDDNTATAATLVADNLSDPLLSSDGPRLPGHFFTGTEATAILQDRVDKKLMPLFSPEELIGRTFIRETQDGEKLRAHVCEFVETYDQFNHEQTKGFLVQLGDEDGRAKEIIAYNELCEIIEKQMDNEIRNDPETLYTFKKIIGHEGPLSKQNKTRNGSAWNVLVQWTDGQETWEPLALMRKEDPITMAEYARTHGLLDTAGWKQLKTYTTKKKKFRTMLNAAKRMSRDTGPRYKFGVRVPKNYKEAKQLDEANNNTLWQDAIDTELKQINDYETFLDKGVDVKMDAPWKRINVHMIFDVKHDLRRKARLVADGHLTKVPRDSCYSGVVSLRSLRAVIAIAEMNGDPIFQADVGNAYLEAKTKETVYIIAGPEFGALEGHTMVIVKALYGLRTSGARWHEHFADTLRDMGFFPCYAEPDVWMRDTGTKYEYVCVYVDDLAIVMENPMEFIELLKSKYNYKLKGVGPLEYHLGADVWRSSDNVLNFGSKKYVERLLSNVKEMFGSEVHPHLTPLKDGDHPEIDESEFLDADGIQKYQSIIGALQWAVSLCRFDIHCAVMTMGRFRVAPRVGHLERLKHICGYLKKYPEGAIRFNMSVPNDEKYQYADSMDWDYSVYGGIKEELPWNAPPPRGKSIRLSCFEDANLYHDYTTGRAAMGMLHMMNGTVVDWFSKRQATVETATYGSEFVAARAGAEQSMDWRYTLRMLGVSIDGPTWMFGDNKSVRDQANLPHATLSKRHNALAFHRVREAIAAGVIVFNHVMGVDNPADVLTKNLPHATAMKHLKELLFSAQVS